jgi:outer membrane lipoprotein SlyB
MNPEDLSADQPTSDVKPSTSSKVGAAGGAIAGAALGRSVAGRLGAVVGGIAGAIAGSKAASPITNFAKEANDTLGLEIGADREVEVPPHYSWEELQALSKPQTAEQ